MSSISSANEVVRSRRSVLAVAASVIALGPARSVYARPEIRQLTTTSAGALTDSGPSTGKTPPPSDGTTSPPIAPQNPPSVVRQALPLGSHGSTPPVAQAQVGWVDGEVVSALPNTGTGS